MRRTLFIIKGMVAAAVVCIVVLLVWWCNRPGGASLKVGFDNRIELTSQEISRIKEIGEWEFLSVRMEVVVDTLRKGFFSDDRLVAIYIGTPRIGIDLTRVGDDWVQVCGDTVTLRLPSPDLLDRNFIDEARTRVFYESGTWSNRARREMYGMARRKMVARSLNLENLQRAEENARNQFTTMFRALGFHCVNVVFAQASGHSSGSCLRPVAGDGRLRCLFLCSVGGCPVFVGRAAHHLLEQPREVLGILES